MCIERVDRDRQTPTKRPEVLMCNVSLEDIIFENYARHHRRWRKMRKTSGIETK